MYAYCIYILYYFRCGIYVSYAELEDLYDCEEDDGT